jgi:uncharacterized membrane protein YphA (DoxX/SURF4 family)
LNRLSLALNVLKFISNKKQLNMDTLLWIIQSILAFVFLHGGLCKTFYAKRKMAFLGQDGVVGLPIAVIRTAGIAEILGAYGLVIPLWLDIIPILTPIAAACLALVMLLAAGTNLSRKKYKNIGINIFLFGLCVFICIGRSIDPYY